MKRFFEKIKSILPSKRKLIQLYSALLFNANLEGFAKGTIYRGEYKGICTPGLNCYSCPGATGACPLGSLQDSLNSSGKRTPYYIIGIILLYGILLGRFICGFLCPFGLIQELLYKIKTPKAKKNKFTRILSYLKYVILVFLVIIVPILYGIRNVPLPGFCKYICPAGTLEGAMGYLSNAVNASELASLGPLFTWKFLLLVSFVLASIFVFRFFCRFFCPLGALYGLFNKISVVGIKLDCNKCTNCGLCHAKCKMDIKKVADHECISCGECIDVCPTKAISWKGSKIVLPENEIVSKEERESLSADKLAEREAEVAKKNEKLSKRRLVTKIVAALLMVAVLATAIVYHNFIDLDATRQTTDTPTGDGDEPVVGNAVGNLCPSYTLELFDENGYTGETFDPTKNNGKITVINFWYTTCPGCVKELPYFDRVASEYKDSVTVLAVHATVLPQTAPGYVKQNYQDSEILFAMDVFNQESSTDEFFAMLGGGDAYPITVILDKDGIIIASIMREVTYEELVSYIESEFSEEQK